MAILFTYNDIIKQIMTDPSANRKIWLEGSRRAWKQLTIARGEAEGNSQLFQALLDPSR